MARKQKQEHAPVLEIAPSLGEALVDEAIAIDAEVEADIAKARSVVKTAYKLRYAERAVEAGHKRKAAQRSTWDWLAQTIAGECLVGKDRIDIARFLALLDANAVDHSRWTNRSKGWEGRLRMTGRLALQRIGIDKKFIHVGDSVRNDVRGAEAAGLVPLHLDPYDDHPDARHRRIRRLHDLLDLIV